MKKASWQRMFLGIGLSMVCLLNAWAEQLSARQIAVRMDEASRSASSSRTAYMLIERQGQKLVRQMEMTSKQYPDQERTLIRFITPPEVHGIMYLTWSHQDSTMDDDLWVFLPDESLIRRISGGGKKGAFMRSDFTNEDLSRREVDDDEHQLLGEERLHGIDCYMLQRVSRLADSAYSKTVVWVRKDIWLPLKIEYYNQLGKPFKTTTYGGFQQFGRYWLATKVQVETPEKASRTLMQYSKVQFDLDIADETFRQSQLKR